MLRTDDLVAKSLDVEELEAKARAAAGPEKEAKNASLEAMARSASVSEALLDELTGLTNVAEPMVGESARPLVGKLISGAKKAVLGSMRPLTAELLRRQIDFNIKILGYLRRLESRLSALEPDAHERMHQAGLDRRLAELEERLSWLEENRSAGA